MDQVNAVAFNNLFIQRLDTEDGVKKAQIQTQQFIRDQIREKGFANGIIPSESVVPTDCQRSTNHDILYKVVDYEHDSKAMIVNFRGEATDKYITGKRFAVPFFKIESELFEKTEGELMAYHYPVTKVIQQNSVKDLQKMLDYKLLEFSGSATNVTGKKIASADVSVVRGNLNKLAKMVDGDRLEAKLFLMTNVDFGDWCVQPFTDVGNVAAEMVVNGYQYKTIMGRRLLVTNKTDILAPGRIFVYTDPQYLGNNFVLNDIKFWIEKKMDRIRFKSWMHVGAALGNIRAVGEIQLSVPSPIPGGGSF